MGCSVTVVGSAFDAGHVEKIRNTSDSLGCTVRFCPDWDAALPHLGDTQILYAPSDSRSPEMIRFTPNLQWFASCFAGVDPLLVPGVLPDAECFEEESHWNGLLEYPQYSRPALWHDRQVPEILLSGDHGKVAAWRKKESYKRTMRRRPDMFARFDESQLTTKAERKILQQAKEELAAEDTE